MKKFNYVPVEIKANLETKEIDGKRFYVTESGSAFPSVTTVTGWEKRAFFAEWRRKNPDESKRVLRRGTRFHSMVETYLKNEPIIQYIDILLAQKTQHASEVIKRIEKFPSQDNGISLESAKKI